MLASGGKLGHTKGTTAGDTDGDGATECDGEGDTLADGDGAGDTLADGDGAVERLGDGVGDRHAGEDAAVHRGASALRQRVLSVTAR